MRNILLVTILAVCMLITPPASAQTDKPRCNPAAVIQFANSLKSAKNAQKDMASLMKLQDSISAARIACNGLTFQGFANKVSQPFVLPPATYKVHVVTKQSFAMNLHTLNGSSCEAGREVSIFNEQKSGSDGSIDAESILPVEIECRVVFQTSGNADNWIVTFEPLD